MGTFLTKTMVILMLQGAAGPRVEKTAKDEETTKVRADARDKDKLGAADDKLSVKQDVIDTLKDGVAKDETVKDMRDDVNDTVKKDTGVDVKEVAKGVGAAIEGVDGLVGHLVPGAEPVVDAINKTIDDANKGGPVVADVVKDVETVLDAKKGVSEKTVQDLSKDLAKDGVKPGADGLEAAPAVELKNGDTETLVVADPAKAAAATDAKGSSGAPKASGGSSDATASGDSSGGTSDKSSGKAGDIALHEAPVGTPTAGDVATQAVNPNVDRLKAGELAIWKRLFQENVPLKLAVEGKYITVEPVMVDNASGMNASTPITGAGLLIYKVVEHHTLKTEGSQALARDAWSKTRLAAARLSAKADADGKLDYQLPAEIPGPDTKVITTTKSGALARFASKHFGNEKQVWQVDVDNQGDSRIHAKYSDNVQHKLGNAARKVKGFVTPDVAQDAVKAVGATHGALMGAAGVLMATASANPVAVGAAAVAAVTALTKLHADIQTIKTARLAANDKAMKETADWAGATLQTNDHATGAEAWQLYKSKLQNTGVRPLSYESFIVAFKPYEHAMVEAQKAQAKAADDAAAPAKAASDKASTSNPQAKADAKPAVVAKN